MDLLSLLFEYLGLNKQQDQQYGYNVPSPGPMSPIPIEAMSQMPSWVPQQYQDIVGYSAQQQGVPVPILAGLLRQESGYNPKAVSPVGAQGIAQFMPDTAKQFGIDPSNPMQAIPAAAKFLAQNFAKAGSWENALAGYNAGPGRMDPSKWQRIPETRQYVSNIMNMARQAGMPQDQRSVPQQTLASNQPNNSANSELLKLLALYASGLLS